MKFDIVVFGVDIFVVGVGKEDYVFMFVILMVCLYVSGIVVMLKVVYLIWSLGVICLVIMIIVIVKDDLGNIIIVEE